MRLTRAAPFSDRRRGSSARAWVIVTGSMVPLCEQPNDAEQNLVDAFHWATENGLHEVCVAFNRQLLRGNHHVAEETYQAVVKQYGVPGTVQVAVTVGYVAMMCMVANAFEAPPVGDGSKTAL